MIELHHISINKSGQKLFHDFSWKINQGENILISGANGSGKTILLEVLAGVTPVAQGEVHYDFITGTSWEERYQQRKQAIHYIPADAAMTQIHQHDLFYQQRYYSLGDEFVPFVKDFLGDEMVKQIHSFDFPASLSIDHLLQLKLTRLSNGQQKRVMILKNLAQQIPKVLLLDYPFEALDRQSRKDLAAFLDHIATKQGVQIILTDHDSELPLVINRKVVLHDFKIQSQSGIANPLSVARAQTRNDSASSASPVVEMKQLTIQYGETIIIKNLNWTINKGERWALAGKNGSGKTTLFSLIFADHPLAYSQQVYLFGKRRGTGESIWDIKNRITYLGPEQMSYLDPKEKLLPARDYILLNRKNADRTKLAELIHHFEATSFIDQSLRLLSSGQVQLVLIIQCFLFQKELLLLDEPFRFLDPIQKERVNQYLQLHLDKDTTLVLITHDEHDMKRWGMQTLWL